MDDRPHRTILVPLNDTRSVALRPRGPGLWFMHVGTKVFEVDDNLLFDPLRLNAKCNLQLSVTQRTLWLRSLTEALRAAKIKINLTKSAPKDDGIWINPTSGIKLTRAQRRQVKKNTARIDKVSDTDRRFFKRFPQRMFRVRLTSQAEIDQVELLEGCKAEPPQGFQYFPAVKLIAPGVRIRLMVAVRRGSGFDDVDLPEEMAREVWERAATAQTKEIEAGMAKMGGR